MSLNRRDVVPAAPAAPPPAGDAAPAAPAASPAPAAVAAIGGRGIKRRRTLAQYLEHSTRGCRRARVDSGGDAAPPDGPGEQPAGGGGPGSGGHGGGAAGRRDFDTVVRCRIEGVATREAVVGRGATQCAVQVRAAAPPCARVLLLRARLRSGF
jgi:hypothetical protein